MQVFFLEDVSNIAKAGDVKDVADGYARNYLIPRKLATIVNPVTIRRFEAGIQAKAEMHSQLKSELLEIASQLEGKEVTLRAKVGAKDRLYGSVTSLDIATQLEKSSGITVDKRKIELHAPIRKLGIYDVPIRLGKDIIPKVKLVVKEEEVDSSSG